VAIAVNDCPVFGAIAGVYPLPSRSVLRRVLENFMRLANSPVAVPRQRKLVHSRTREGHQECPEVDPAYVLALGLICFSFDRANLFGLGFSKLSLPLRLAECAPRDDRIHRLYVFHNHISISRTMVCREADQQIIRFNLRLK
jgi:hypothetical protein